MFDSLFRLLLGITSERTTEVNLLFDISLIIKQRFKTNVTIISPSRIERNEQEFDPLTQILRNGRIIVFQFLKPYSGPLRNRNDNYTKFVIKTSGITIYYEASGTNRLFIFL